MLSRHYFFFPLSPKQFAYNHRVVKVQKSQQRLVLSWLLLVSSVEEAPKSRKSQDKLNITQISDTIAIHHIYASEEGSLKLA